MSNLSTLQKNLQDLYKYSSLNEKSPRFEQLNGSSVRLSLNFVSLSNRTVMDDESWKKIMGTVERTLSGKYKMVGFNMGRNNCLIILEKEA